jgi:hypothetical protein
MNEGSQIDADASLDTMQAGISGELEAQWG